VPTALPVIAAHIAASQATGNPLADCFLYPLQVELVESEMLQYCESCTQQYDVVMSSYAVHHLSVPNKQRLLAAVARLLKPGGCFLLVDVFRAEGEALLCCCPWLLLLPELHLCLLECVMPGRAWIACQRACWWCWCMPSSHGASLMAAAQALLAAADKRACVQHLVPARWCLLCEHAVRACL
jgi:SAM-dependent methyltransferase